MSARSCWVTWGIVFHDFGQMLGGLAPNSAHRDPLDLAPLGEVGKLGLGEMSGKGRRLRGGSRRGQQTLRVGFNVVVADESARTGALDFINVDAELAGKTPHMRRGRNGLAVFGAGNFAQLRRHAEPRSRLLRLVGREGLFFGFSFGANRSLKRQARSMLSGNVFHRSVSRAGRLRWRRCSAFQREDHLSDFDLLAFFHFDIFHTPLTDDGTSTTALSVSSSITGWPSATFEPGAIISRTRSPCEMFSPSSGSLNSLAPESMARRCRRWS